MESRIRRHDLDWLRVIAIGLLLIYHSAIGFQFWGRLIGFITNEESWNSLWLPMTMLNIWRIPILFYVSGMGFCLAMQNKSWKQLLIDRFKRIGLPLVFGSLFVVPIHWFIFQNYYLQELTFKPGMGHLWFLGNIVIYVVILSPILLLFRNVKENIFLECISKILKSPLIFILVFTAFILESVILNPAKALGIEGIQSNIGTWSNANAQIDLVMERADKITNIFEIKHASGPFTITKKYDQELRNKLQQYKDEHGTKSSLWPVFISPYGLADSPYKYSFIKQIVMGDLF